MVPTIDIGVTAVLTAIGAFLAWVWRFSCAAVQFTVDKIKLLYYGNALFRAAVHVSIFIAVYVLFSRAIDYFWGVVSGYVFSQLPTGLQRGFSLLALVFPLSAFLDVTRHVVVLLGLGMTVNLAYISFRRVERWLFRLTSGGK